MMAHMQTQMTRIGIGFAALAALAAEGKDFNRTASSDGVLGVCKNVTKYVKLLCKQY